MVTTPNLSPENTELSADELAGLIPSLATKQDLNEFERENIIVATAWALSERILKQCEPWSEAYIRELHRRMFEETWKWAGIYRKTNKNLGVPFEQIREQLPTVLGEAKYWIDNKTYDLDEIAVCMHHRLVLIHPFPNGNGRHARLLADVLLAKLGRKPFTWGAANLVSPGPPREIYIAALKTADSGDIQPLVKFARS
jgi:Fic-DOC domain mobile mystery protein B